LMTAPASGSRTMAHRYDWAAVGLSRLAGIERRKDYPLATDQATLL
jgi:hypothetical protein